MTEPDPLETARTHLEWAQTQVADAQRKLIEAQTTLQTAKRNYDVIRYQPRNGQP
ncbi:hypothetical protein [Nocardia brasiliensis]|uniref:hypothetical protein n=1 Tax=Nocardia brasiliensis TaxID=37326 RepID=UPI002456A23D|nr:hypothetical protein [Nocardia brasiliensis]